MIAGADRDGRSIELDRTISSIRKGNNQHERLHQQGAIELHADPPVATVVSNALVELAVCGYKRRLLKRPAVNPIKQPKRVPTPAAIPRDTNGCRRT